MTTDELRDERDRLHQRGAINHEWQRIADMSTAELLGHAPASKPAAPAKRQTKRTAAKRSTTTQAERIDELGQLYRRGTPEQRAQAKAELQAIARAGGSNRSIGRDERADAHRRP